MFKTKFVIKQILLGIRGIFVLSGCGKSSISESSPESLEIGYFEYYDGLEYVYRDTRRIIDGNTFSYFLNETVGFYMGNIKIGEDTLAGPNAAIVIDDILPDKNEYPDFYIKTIRFLQTLNDDSDISDGIYILEDVLESASMVLQINFCANQTMFENEVNLILSEITNGSTDALVPLDAVVYYESAPFIIITGDRIPWGIPMYLNLSQNMASPILS